MSAQFRSRFIFKLLASTLFLENENFCFYNERHHGKCPMDVVGGTLKNVVFRKVKSGRPYSRPWRTLQKLQQNLYRQLQPNIYQRKLRLQTRKIKIMPHWSRTRYKFISWKDILIKEINLNRIFWNGCRWETILYWMVKQYWWVDLLSQRFQCSCKSMRRMP